MKHILTGCQPTSDQLHIGNYFGAIQPILDLMSEQDVQTTMIIVDLHSITKILDIPNPNLHLYSLNIAKLYIACGLNPEKCLIFKQSDVHAHAELSWVLSCFTHIGFMQRMHAYKDAVNKGSENTMSIGSMNYPILMASDILLYDPDIIPVGKDNKQHLEYMRDVVDKCNHRYGQIFKSPDPYIVPDIAEIPGIDGRKMSKSYNNFLWLLDTPEILRKKINKIVTTDLLPSDPKDPSTCNVYNMLKVFLSPEEQSDLIQRYERGWLSYKEVKDMLYERVIHLLTPIQQQFAQIDDASVHQILRDHALIANHRANQKIQQVYEAIGFR